MTSQARGTTMTRDEVLAQLRAHKATLSQRFGVTDLALFGSFARDQNAGKSDVDILVRFDRPRHLGHLLRDPVLYRRLARLQVDLVTDKALRVELRPYVEREAVSV